MAHPESTPEHTNTPHILSLLCSDCHGRVPRGTDVRTSHVKDYDDNATQWPIHVTGKKKEEDWKGMLLLFFTTQNKEKAPVNSLFCAFLLLVLATEYVKKAHRVGSKQIAYVYILYSVRKPIQVELFHSINVYRGTRIKIHKYVYLLCTN